MRKNLSQALFIAGVVAIAGVLAALVRGGLSPAPESRRAPSARVPSGRVPSAGAQTPPAVLERDGRTRTLSTPAGKVLIVHFWATWCPPCAEELPSLAAYARQVLGKPEVELLTVSVDKDFKTVDKWLAQRGLGGFEVALDPDRRVAAHFGTEKFPETWVLGPDGAILAHVAGPIDWSSEGLRNELQRFRTPSRRPS